MESLGNEVAGASPILEPPCDGDDAPTSTSSSNSDLPSATEGLRPAGSRRRSTKTFTGLRLFGRSLCSLGSKAFQTQSTSITNYCPVQQAQSHPITEGNGWKWVSCLLACPLLLYNVNGAKCLCFVLLCVCLRNTWDNMGMRPGIHACWLTVGY
ncbi:diacylglycerol kinase zeta-like isoform X7 [Arapaima gigas]